LLAASLAAAATVPHQSLADLVTANGYGVITWEGDRLTNGWPAVYSQADAGTTTGDLLYDTYFGLTDLDGAGQWLLDPETAELVGGTGVIRLVQAVGDLEISTYAFAPMGLGAFGLAQVARVRNASATTATPSFQLVSLSNWKLGGSEMAVASDSEHVTERGSTLALYYEAPGADRASCEGVYDQVLAGGAVIGACAGGYGDIIPGFGFRIPALGPGQEAWAGVLVAGEPATGWIDGRDARAWVLDELEAWEAWHGGVPAELTADEAAVYRQSLAYLRMHQSREEGGAYGQIPASSMLMGADAAFQHQWNIAWVRDGAYAAVALARAGHVTEAEEALRFMVQEGKVGAYSSYISDLSYRVSVCRYYGDGTEWSDEDDDGPNIELDDFGLFLWAVGETAARGDGTFLAEIGPVALDGVADPLSQLVDATNGLVVADSSIWERHWNGQQKQHAFTSAWAVAGLQAAAALADSLGDARADGYAAASDAIAAAIAGSLVDGTGVAAGSVEELAAGTGYADLAAVEVFNTGVLPMDGTEFAASTAAWEALRTANGVGFARNDDGEAYDTEDWPFVDLRLARALRAACRGDEAAVLEDWITQNAALNAGMIPELLDPGSGAYEGPAPMLGFGAGVYVLEMLERAELSAGCPADTGDPAADTAAVPPPGGCGCAAGRGRVTGWAVAIGVVRLVRRRSGPRRA
jgi:hypothetical protein